MLVESGEEFTNQEHSLGSSESVANFLLLRDKLSVEVNGQSIEVETVPASGAAEMAEFDKRLFGEHKALSAEDLLQINNNGELVAVRDAEGSMVGEGQVITSAISDAEEPLVRELPSDAGYFEGFAVAPEHQGKGVSVALARAIETKIRQAGKKDAWATVRVENLPSVAALTKEGYVIIGYDQDYYEGESLTGARLIVRKDLDKQDADHLDLTPGTDVIRVPVPAGDDVDAEAHERVQQALGDGYVGVRTERDGEVSYIVFAKTSDIADEDYQSRVTNRQTFLREHQIT
jgi:ribosomal protein S18 acetylase RimI-like enzyme